MIRKIKGGYRLYRIAFCQKILVIKIRNVNILPSCVERVEATVSVFFELAEIG